MKQKILAWILVCSLILGLCAAPASAAPATRQVYTFSSEPAETVAEEGIEWTLNDGLLILSGEGAMEDYAPGEAPWLGEEIYSVIIEDGITHLGSNAFRGMPLLVEVTIGTDAVSMGESVFAECPELLRVTFHGSMGTIPTGSFDNCPQLSDFWFRGDQPVLEARSLNTGAQEIHLRYDIDNPTWAQDVNGNVTSSMLGISSYDLRWGESGSCGENVTWQILYDEQLHADSDILLISGTGPMADFAEGEAPWLPYCDTVYTLVVTNGVSTIGSGAFRNHHLSEIYLAGSVREIGAEAFRGVTNLWRLPYTPNIRYVGDYAFADSSVGLVTGGTPLPLMGVGVYENCTNLSRVALQNGTIAIPDRTFFGCAAMEKITVPYSVTVIGQDAFAGCTALETVTYNGTTSQWDAMDIGSGNEAFLNAELLGITATSGSCGESAQWDLNEETGVLTISGTGSVDSKPWFNAASQIQTVVVEEGITALGDEVLRDLDNLTQVELPDTLTAFGKGTFSNCDILESVVIPAGVTEIPDELFYYCKQLVSVQLHEGITAIGARAFSMCESLSDIQIPAGLQNLGGDAFYNCDSLTQFDWPAAVTYVGTALGSSGIRELVLPETVTAIGDYAFDGCTDLETIVIPDSVTSLGEYAFRTTKKLSQIHIPAQIDTIPFSCFYSSGITSVEIPEGVTSIERYAFQSCEKLEQVVLPESLTSIASEVFTYCSSLTQINWPSGVDTIGWHQFRGTALVEFTVPATVLEVGDYAFMDCTKLEKLVFEGKDTVLSGGQIFDNTPLLTIWCWYDSSAQHQAEFQSIPYVLFDPPADLPVYPVLFSIIGDGTITADPAESTGYEWITLEVTPTSESQLFSLNIYYYSDVELDLRAEQLSETTFRFLMPKCPVLIEAAFQNIATGFIDIKSSDFFYEPVIWAVENGITTGATEFEFNPNGDCLRAQFVTFLWRTEGCPEPTSTENPFTDVTESDFYYKAVLWAVENGITNGTTATTFGPMAVCNRAQVVTFLWRAMGSPDATGSANPFFDVPGDIWYTEPVLWAVENGITNGMSATEFGPNMSCNRAQVVTFLYRAYAE